jgi:hypothetical protein
MVSSAGSNSCDYQSNSNSAPAPRTCI